MLAARRSGVRRTCFVSTHEPTRAGRPPRITRITKVAEQPNGVLVRVDANEFTDYAAVRFGADIADPQPLHFLLPDGQFASIKTYGYIRVTKSGEVLGRGDWIGFRLPLGSSQFNLNGKPATTKHEGGDMIFGVPAPQDIAPSLEPAECPFPAAMIPAAPLRMFAQDRRAATLEIKNTLTKPLRGFVEFTAPAGVVVEPAKVELDRKSTRLNSSH